MHKSDCALSGGCTRVIGLVGGVCTMIMCECMWGVCVQRDCVIVFKLIQMSVRQHRMFGCLLACMRHARVWMKCRCMGIEFASEHVCAVGTNG